MRELVISSSTIFPERNRIKGKDQIIWWNQDCDNARSHYISLKNKIKQLNKRKLLPPADLIDRARSAHHALKYTIRRTKRESFREMVRVVNTVHDMSKLDKIIDRKESHYLGLVNKPDGSCSTS